MLYNRSHTQASYTLRNPYIIRSSIGGFIISRWSRGASPTANPNSRVQVQGSMVGCAAPGLHRDIMNPPILLSWQSYTKMQFASFFFCIKNRNPNTFTFWPHTLKTGTPVDDGDSILRLLWGVSPPEIQLRVGIYSEFQWTGIFLVNEQGIYHTGKRQNLPCCIPKILLECIYCGVPDPPCLSKTMLCHLNVLSVSVN